MKNRNQIESDAVQTAAISAVAAASQTPFKTAFKITFGIAIAQLVIGLMFLAGCAVIAGVSYLLVK